MGEATGFCVKARDGTLLIRTLMPAERGAKVNWLIEQAGVIVMDGVPDEALNAAFDEYSAPYGCRVVCVTIREVLQ